MSDSLPPDEDEGPDPYAGQDLDGLLSGTDDDFPAGLRPVAATLDALRAPPMRGELGGEAAARADFRRLMLGAGSGSWPSDDSGDARTLILPVEAAGVGQRPPQGRHRRRRPARWGNWQAKTLAGAAAAAVVVVGAAALTGTFSGSGSPSRQAGGSPSAMKASPYTTTPGSKSLEGNGAQDATSHPSPTTSAQSGDDTADRPSDLCREFYDHSLSKPDRNALYKYLSKLAYPMDVKPYCLRYLQVYDAGQAGQGGQGPHGMYWPPLRSGDWNQNGNGQGKNASGPGGQDQDQQ